MAKNTSRSMNDDLRTGMIEGKYKQVVKDRSTAEPTTYDSREDLFDIWYGIHETPVKQLPDGRSTNTDNYVPTKEASPKAI